jgi:hypothetical protein
MYNHVTRQAVITRDISKWEEFNREVITEVVPLFDEELISQHKLMKILNKAGEDTGLQGVEFKEDEVDEVELDAITKLQSESSNNGGPHVIPEDNDSDDDENSIPILGPRIVDNESNDESEEPEYHVIADGEEEGDRLNNDNSDGDDDGDGDNVSENFDDDNENDKVHRELAKLDADLEDVDLSEGIRTRSQVYVVDVVTDEVVFNAKAVNSDGDAPKTFHAATKSQLRKYWIKAACREINNFMKRGAWKRVKWSELPKGKRPLKVKWVFKIKENETGDDRYKGRIVIKGYTEIPGVDYTESFAPVATTSSINMVIAIGLYRENEGWVTETLDIEAAFLESDMDPNTEVFIDWPDGMVELDYITEEIKRDYCILLNAPMYGKVDVPLMFQRTLTKQLKAIGCIESKVDPCVHCVREGGKVVLVGATTVDDILVAGQSNAIQKYKEGLRKRFTIKELGPLKRHLQISYEKRRDAAGDSFYVLSLPKMKEEIVRKFESFVKREIKTTTTPGYPRKHLVKYDGEAVHLDEYRSMVGKVLYYAKKVAPDMNNAVRELAQFLSKPGPEHWKALERCVGYVKSNRFKWGIMDYKTEGAKDRKRSRFESWN